MISPVQHASPVIAGQLLTTSSCPFKAPARPVPATACRVVQIRHLRNAMNRPCFEGTRSIDVMYLTQYDALGGYAPAPYASPRHLAEPVSLSTIQQMAACVQLESRLSRAWRFSNRGMSAADPTGNPVKSAEYRGERIMIVALKQLHSQADGCPLGMTWDPCPYLQRISSEIFMVACVIFYKLIRTAGAQMITLTIMDLSAESRFFRWSRMG